MLQPKLIDAFKFQRKQSRFRAASTALALARSDVAANVDRYPTSRGGMRGGQDFKIGFDDVFWCECPDDYLRRVGFADECGLRSIRHDGWYLDDYGHGERARGVVFQLSGKNGAPRFMYGVADPYNEGPAILSHDITDDKTDAARWADHLAECYAETERDYQRVSSAGIQYRELGDEITAQRSETLALIREVKGACSTLRTMPETRRVVANAIRAYLRDTRKARKKRAELLDTYGHQDAFNEG